jgi:hypothetical protein
MCLSRLVEWKPVANEEASPNYGAKVIIYSVIRDLASAGTNVTASMFDVCIVVSRGEDRRRKDRRHIDELASGAAQPEQARIACARR